MGEHLSIDETSLSNGELYTIVTNKKARGREHSLVAIVLGTDSDEVLRALRQIDSGARRKVTEVTLDLSDSMNRVCRYAFPGAKRVIDRFHVQKQVLEAVQEVRIAHRWDAINADTEAREQAKLTGEKYEPARLSNGDTLSAALQAGDIDAAYGMAYEAYPNFENDNYQFSSIQTSRAFFGSMNMTSSIIQDPAVRKAIAMGIDKQGFVSALLDGHGVPGNGAFPDGFATFGGENVTTESYDPEDAKAVLEAAGWLDSDGDGIREKDGVKLTIRWLTYPSRQELPLLAESAQATLKDIGIDVDINCTANRREFLADMTSWDIYASAMVTAPSGDPQYFFTSCCVPGMSYNFGAYENTDVNAMIDELATEFDTEKRGELAVKLQQTILDDNAYVFCSFLQMNMISKSTVTGYTAHACDYYQVTADLDING